MANKVDPSTSMPWVAPPLPKVFQVTPSSAVTSMLLPLLTTQRSLLGSYSTASMEVRVWPHAEVKQAAEQSRREDSRFMGRKVRPQSSDSCGVCRDQVRAAKT